MNIDYKTTRCDHARYRRRVVIVVVSVRARRAALASRPARVSPIDVFEPTNLFRRLYAFDLASEFPV